MVVLKLKLDIMEKNQEIWRPLAIKGGATRQQFETYTRYSEVDDEEQKKAQAVLLVFFEKSCQREPYLI